MASAQFEIDPGTGTFGASPQVAGSGGVTVNCRLLSIAGVQPGLIAWSIEGTNRSAVATPTITPGGTPLGFSCSFAVPAGTNRAYLIRCRVNGGPEVTGEATTQYQGKVYVLNANARQPIAFGETTEGNATHGYVELFDEINNQTGSGADAISLRSKVLDNTTVGSPTRGDVIWFAGTNYEAGKTLSQTSIGTAQTLGLKLSNVTTASPGSPQYSPVFELEGRWDPESESAVAYGFQCQPGITAGEKALVILQDGSERISFRDSEIWVKPPSYNARRAIGIDGGSNAVLFGSGTADTRFLADASLALEVNDIEVAAFTDTTLTLTGLAATATRTSIGTSIGSNGLTLRNTTAATVGPNHQYSPSLVVEGRYYSGSDKSYAACLQVQSSALGLSYNDNGGGWHPLAGFENGTFYLSKFSGSDYTLKALAFSGVDTLVVGGAAGQWSKVEAIGTDAVTTRINQTVGSVNLGTLSDGTYVSLVTGLTTQRGYQSFQINSGGQGARMSMYKARGTPSSLSAPNDNDGVGRLEFRAWDGSAWVTTGYLDTQIAQEYGTISGSLYATEATLNSEGPSWAQNSLGTSALRVPLAHTWYDNRTLSNNTPTVVLAVPVASDTMTVLRVHCVGRDQTSGDMAEYVREFRVERVTTGDPALRGTAYIDSTYEADASWDFTYAVNTTTDTVEFTITSDATNNVKWATYVWEMAIPFPA